MTPMKNSLTPSDNQVGKLYDRLLSAARKSLEDKLLETIVLFSKKASGIFTPIKAQDTGLVPAGWKVISDDLEPEINLAKLDLNYCPVHDDESVINGDTLLKRAKEVNVLGSLGFAKLVLDAQKQGKDIIPPELRGKYIVCSRTILQGDNGSQRVACLYWNGEQWVLNFYWLRSCFYRNARLPRSRE
jgi:hypothetical protein